MDSVYKSILLASLLLITGAFQAFAQVYVKGVDINQKNDLKVIEMLSLEDAVVSSRIKVAIDYGQTRKEFEGKITDKEGNPKLFGSLVEAINLLENNGWEMFDHSITLKGRGFLYRYYFRKKQS